MKPIVLILAAACGLAGGYLGAQLATSNDSAEVPEALRPVDVGGGADRVGDPGGDPGDFEVLRRELEDLRFRLSQVEGRGQRESVPVELEEEVPEEVVAIPTPEERTKILTVLEQERERQKHEAAVAREKRAQDEIHRRASLVADKLALPTGSEQQIAGVFLEERDKLAAAREAYRGADQGPDSRRLYRESLVEVRDWRNGQLEVLFGTEVAMKVTKAADRSWGKGDGKVKQGKKERE